MNKNNTDHKIIYKIVSGGSYKFGDIVSEYLVSGWELYGNPYKDENYHYQAVIKKVKKE